MEAIKKLNDTQLEALARALPAEAIGQHPSKSFLSTIKAIYVTERLNEVFGVGEWMVRAEPIAREGKMVVVKVKFEVPEYGIYYECFGGNDNSDLGDAYKGATTDAITKIGSWLGIGAEVFKGKVKPAPAPAQPTKKRKTITDEHLTDSIMADQLLKWAYAARNAHGAENFDAGAHLAKYYEVSDRVKTSFHNLFNSYLQALGH